MLERRQWNIWGIFTINCDLFQYSDFIYHFELVLFHGFAYSAKVQLIPEYCKIAKWKCTLGISHLASFAKFVRVRINR